jgi:hypothetical protein
MLLKSNATRVIVISDHAEINNGPVQFAPAFFIALYMLISFYFTIISQIV